MPTKQTQIKNIKEGDYIVIEDEPCVTKKRSSSAPGKHGSTKIKITAEGITDGQKRRIVKPSNDNVKVPIIDKNKAQVLSVSGDSVQLMDLSSYDTFEIAIPEDFGELDEGEEVTYWQVMGKKILKSKN